MSRPLTLEQSLLSKADEYLTSIFSAYEQRMQVLEAYAARIGGFDIEKYWSTFQIEVNDVDLVKDATETLDIFLSIAGISTSLALSSLARESIPFSEKKKNGAFYTDFRLAQFVADDCSSCINSESSVADIAAGSGILLAAIADKYYSLYPENYDQWISKHVFAYDLSANALRGARIALMVHATSVGAIKSMCENWLVCDSLLTEDRVFPQFDIVVGNPPWGKVKLSLHSFVNKTDEDYHVYGSQYGEFDKEQFLSEKQSALGYSKVLKNRYSLLGDAEPDMYMAFLQKAISVLTPGGHLSYLVPAGLIRSLGTEELRRFLIGSSEKLKYYLLDNKANFFEIDTRFKFVVISQKKKHSKSSGCDSFQFEICNGNKCGISRNEEIRFIVKELEKIRPDLTIPECRSKTEKNLFCKICRNGRSWKDAWRVDIAREVDMTNDRTDFHEKNSDSDIPVIEGRMVQQFRFGAKAYVSGSGRSAKWVPNVGTIKAQFFMSREDLNDQLRRRIDTLRAGYCDIAGQTNERAMMTAIVPAGVVCGNKVPTIVFPGDDGEKQLYFFIGVTNSFAFDWVLRRVLSTTVNYFLLFSIPMPDIDLNSKLSSKIISLTKELSEMGAEYYTDAKMGRLRAELDLAVAQSYGLDFSDLELIMKDFPLLDRHQPPVNGEHRSTYTRDLLLSIAEKEFGKKERDYTRRAELAEKQDARAYIPTEMVELMRRPKMTERPNIKLVIYKRIVEGDLSKFTATSNITPSGGGARDLRFSPAAEFFPMFQRMFPADADGILRGQFFWPDHAPTEVEIHPPTNSRPNEIRIGRIHECFPQEVIPEDSTDCVLLIVLNDSGEVYPHFTSIESLRHQGWHPAVKNPIIAGLTAHRSARTTAMGYVDIENERSYTNGRT